MNETAQHGNTDIQGHLNVSRNANVGGSLKAEGSSYIGHNLTVKGWVDAPHIKGPLKGLYASAEALKTAYPRPMPGWFALVGSTLPADVWRVDGKEWVPTGEQGGEFNLWLDQLEGDMESTREEVKDIEEFLDNGLIDGESIAYSSTASQVSMGFNLKSRNGTQRPISRQLPIADTTKAGAISRADMVRLRTAYTTAEEAKESADNALDEITGLKESIGKANGIAGLNRYGEVSFGNLPSEAYNVAEFLEMVEDVSYYPETNNLSSQSGDCRVVWDKSRKIFLLEYCLRPVEVGGLGGREESRPYSEHTIQTQEETEGGVSRIAGVDSGGIGIETPTAPLTPVYYGRWLDDKRYGEYSEQAHGIRPVINKIYVCTGNRKSYYLRQGDLSPIGSDLDLGYTAGTAFPGDEGNLLRERYEAMQKDYARTKEELSELRDLIGRFDINYATMRIEWLEAEGDLAASLSEHTTQTQEEDDGVWSKVLPSRINSEERFRVWVSVNGSHQVSGITQWKVLRDSGDATADSDWDLRHPLSATDEGYAYITLRPEDLQNSAGTIFRFRCNYSRERNGVTFFQTVEGEFRLELGGLLFYIDRGPWQTGVQYHSNSLNLENRLETSDTYRYGNKWRCMYPHLSNESNGPGFGQRFWEWIEGDPDLHVEFLEGVTVTSKDNPVIPLTLSIKYHGEDVTRFVSDSDIKWSRESKDNDGYRRELLDAVWNEQNMYRGKSPVFTAEDCQSEYHGYPEGLSELIFIVEVTLRDPETTRMLSRTRSSITISK